MILYVICNQFLILRLRNYFIIDIYNCDFIISERFGDSIAYEI